MPPRHALTLTLSLSTLLFPACSDRPEAPRPAAPPEPVIQAAAPLPPAPQPEVPEAPHVEEVAAERAFVVRGGRGPGHAVLFGGQCAQPQGYAEAIKRAAAVLAAYGWSDIAVPPYGVHDERFEDEAIDRLFALNAERAAEEKRLGVRVGAKQKGAGKGKAAAKTAKPRGKKGAAGEQLGLLGEEEKE